jgi:hypothetical protein
MDGCLLNDAFPTGAVGSPGCQDRTSGDESRRQEKKKARRCRGPAASYLNSGMNMVGAVDDMSAMGAVGAVDPDRPAVQRMSPVTSLQSQTGLMEHRPVTQQYEYESFVGEMDNLPEIRQNVAGPDSLQNGKTSSSFFGASPMEESNTKKTNTFIENFSSSGAPFVDIIGDDSSYKLSPDFGTTFTMKGSQKAGGSKQEQISLDNQQNSYLTPTQMTPNSILPFPNVDMFWKNNPTTGGQSSFFSSLKAPGGQPSGSYKDAVEEVHGSSPREVLVKLDKIFARLDDMESAKSENAQTEVLLFIMTGLGVIFLMDIGCRTAAAFAGRR